MSGNLCLGDKLFRTLNLYLSHSDLKDFLPVLSALYALFNLVLLALSLGSEPAGALKLSPVPNTNYLSC